MKLGRNKIYRRREYRRADPLRRRVIEIRYSVALAVRKMRKQAKLSQKAVAFKLDMAPSTVSAIECASSRVTLDQAVRVMIQLGADDNAIADAFNPGRIRGIQILRQAIGRPLLNLAEPSAIAALDRKYGVTIKRPRTPPSS
jgi:transcriptional regulator with XRE-family HTH domain